MFLFTNFHYHTIVNAASKEVKLSSIMEMWLSVQITYKFIVQNYNHHLLFLIRWGVIVLMPWFYYTNWWLVFVWVCCKILHSYYSCCLSQMIFAMNLYVSLWIEPSTCANSFVVGFHFSTSRHCSCGCCIGLLDRAKICNFRWRQCWCWNCSICEMGNANNCKYIYSPGNLYFHHNHFDYMIL